MHLVFIIIIFINVYYQYKFIYLYLACLLFFETLVLLYNVISKHVWKLLSEGGGG